MRLDGDGVPMQVELTLYGPPGRIVGEKRVERELGDGTTVRAVFEELVEEHPDLVGWLLTEDGGVPSSANLTVNGRSLDRADGLDTELEAGDVLRVAPMLEGG